MKRWFGLILVLTVSTILYVGTVISASSTVIRMIAWGYMPSRSMEVTTENPYPQQALKLIAEDWEKLHPGYKIEFVQTTGADIDYQRVMRAQLTGGTAPEIIFWWPSADELAKKGWIVNMDPYLAKPNPYVPGNKRWQDLFIPGALNPHNLAEDGHYYYIPYDVFATSVWYNKDIFKEVGIVPPETWKEFLTIQAKIKGAGYIPFFGPAMWSWWPRGVFGPMLYDQEEMVKQLDVLNKNGRVDPEERARAWKKGIISVRDPRFREYLVLMKQWSEFWPKGFTLQPGAIDSRRMFLRGELAMEWSDAWSLTAIKDNPLRKFDFSFFYFPKLTKETSSLATGASAGFVVHPGTAGEITNSAVKKKLVDICVDWLMFLTTPENNERLTQEKTAVKKVPAVRGVKTVPELAPLAAQMEQPPIDFPVPWAPGIEASTNWDRIFELYMLDKLSLDQALDQMEDWAKKGLEREIRDNPTWDVSRW